MPHPPRLAVPRSTALRALALAVAALLAFTAACNGDSTESTPTPEASPTPGATRQPTATPTPRITATPFVLAPRVAPDDRTGNVPLDALIDLLIDGAAADIRERVGVKPAFIPTCTPGSASDPMIAIDTDEWIATLAGADRSLYAVRRGQSTGNSIDVILSLGSGDDEVRWRFEVSTVRGTNANLTQVQLPCDRPGDWGVPLSGSSYLVVPPVAEFDVAQPVTPPALDENGWPEDAVGPLVVYSYRVRQQRDPENPLHPYSVVAIVTYDAGAARELGRFELSERDRTVEVIGRAGSELLINRGRTGPDLVGRDVVGRDVGVYAYSLAGDERRLVTDVFRDTYLTPVLSPDRSTLAGLSSVLDECEPLRECIAFAPTDSGEPTIYPNARAELVPEAWTADGTAVIAGALTHSEAPGPTYLVTLDGDATKLAPSSFVAPGGAHLAEPTDPRLPWVQDAFGCEIYHTLTIRRVTRDPAGAAAGVIATVSLPGASTPAYGSIQWSPDGRSMLVTAHATPEDTTESCLSVAWKWRQTPELTFRHDLATGETTEVPSPNALRAEWTGAPVIATRCLGEDTVLLPNATAHWSFDTCADPDAQLRWSDLLIDGTLVATLTTPVDANVIAIVTAQDR